MSIEFKSIYLELTQDTTTSYSNNILPYNLTEQVLLEVPPGSSSIILLGISFSTTTVGSPLSSYTQVLSVTPTAGDVEQFAYEANDFSSVLDNSVFSSTKRRILNADDQLVLNGRYYDTSSGTNDSGVTLPSPYLTCTINYIEISRKGGEVIVPTLAPNEGRVAQLYGHNLKWVTPTIEVSDYDFEVIRSELRYKTSGGTFTYAYFKSYHDEGLGINQTMEQTTYSTAHLASYNTYFPSSLLYEKLSEYKGSTFTADDVAISRNAAIAAGDNSFRMGFVVHNRSKNKCLCFRLDGLAVVNALFTLTLTDNVPFLISRATRTVIPSSNRWRYVPNFYWFPFAALSPERKYRSWEHFLFQSPNSNGIYYIEDVSLIVQRTAVNTYALTNVATSNNNFPPFRNYWPSIDFTQFSLFD